MRATITAKGQVLSGQMVRFALVGAVNTGTYYVFYLLLLTRISYVVAHVVAFLLSMTGSFFLHSRFTYRTRPTLAKFLLFPLSNVANFLVTTGGVYLLVHVMRLSSHYAPLIAAVAAVPITFVLSRAIMLRPDRPGRPTRGGLPGRVPPPEPCGPPEDGPSPANTEDPAAVS